MKLLDSIHEAGAGAKCLITLAAVAAALLIGGVFISILHVNPQIGRASCRERVFRAV